jgi:putative transposase
MIMTPVNVEEYPKIIGMIKSYFSRHVDIEDAIWLQQSASRQKQRYKPVWQRRYYEHVIRNEKDYREKIEYMQNNPVKHGLADDIFGWEYSSFFKRKI